MDLENIVSLVTGAGVHIGKAIAVKIGRLGMRVMIYYHFSVEGAKQTIQNLPGKETNLISLTMGIARALSPEEQVNGIAREQFCFLLSILKWI